MKRVFLSLLAVVVATFVAVAPAGAQGDQTVTSDPASVSEAGEHELTVTGTGYSGPAFLLPCPGADGDLTKAADDGACDLSNLTAVTPDDDGNIPATTVTFDIPAEGLVIVIGTSDRSEVAATVISVDGAAAADDAADDDAAEEPAAADDAAEEEADDTPAATTTNALPQTGGEAFQVIVIGATMLLAGLMIARFSRRARW